MSPTINLNRKSLALLIAIVCSGSAQGEEYYFDPALLQGATYGQNIARFNEQQTPSGDYLADVYVNGTLVTSSTNIRFNAVKEGQQTEPCLPLSVMKAAQIKSLPATDAATECRPLREWVPHAGWQFDSATLRLLLTIPMTELTHKPRGYISPSEWDSGALALFLRHNTNWTHTENTDSHYRYQYLWSGLNMGVNLGLWQVRHQSNLRYANSNQSGSAWRYNSVRTWVQRPVASINSILSLGDSYTDSSLFGSLSFNGAKLVTDERMRPQGKRGYAPEVRGVAASSAHVVVKQLGKVIYETNVPPGPFYIDDLYNTRYQGDLEVEVIEASGKTSRFTVPYSSVPDSVRPGNWHYSLAFGRVRQYYDIENRFFEGTFQHGVNNTITLNLGSRIAQRYQAWLAGGVWATGMGAFGLNATWSNARAEHNDRQQGWRAELSYSKTFTTGTNLVLAAYRYSTNGFRDLQDVLGVRREAKTGIDYYSDTLHQRNRLSATVSQPLGRPGTLNLSASTADYYNNQSRITQLQMGYSNQWRNISYGVNIARQRTTWDYDRFYHGVNEPLDVSSRQKYTETTMSFNVSIPLDWGENRTSVAMNYNQSSQSRSSTVSMTGSSGENSDLSWSVYGGYERYRNSNSDSSAPTTFGGNLQQNTRFGALRANYDQGDNYRQEGLGASGTLVLHSGGLTAGPYTSDTFALMWADLCPYRPSVGFSTGAISVSNSETFQPSGTLLASGIGNFLTAATGTPYSSKQVLYRCDSADAGKLYEMYSTNGDSAFAGAFFTPEVEGAYYDVERNVAVRMTNLSTGEYYSRFWKERQLTADSWFQDDKYIYIPASAFSNVLYEMFKIDSRKYFAYQNPMDRDTWAQPRGYIAFKGPGLITERIKAGLDHASDYYGWPSYWPGAWSTYNSVTYVRGALCKITDYPAIVKIPPVAVGILAAGGNSQAPFHVSLECESGAVSSALPSTSAANVAMGFVVNQPTAVAAARRLGLTTSAGGLSWLLDTHYGEPGVASGVGIRIYNDAGTPINLLPDRIKTGTGNARGWYGYKDLTTRVSSGSVETYSGDFTASLEAIGGQTVTAGSVNAQLQAVVSFQ